MHVCRQGYGFFYVMWFPHILLFNTVFLGLVYKSMYVDKGMDFVRYECMYLCVIENGCVKGGWGEVSDESM